MGRFDSKDSRSATLPRVLGPVDAFCVVVGCTIGSGIFLVPATVAENVPFHERHRSRLGHRWIVQPGGRAHARRARGHVAAGRRALRLPAGGVRGSRRIPVRLG